MLAVEKEKISEKRCPICSSTIPNRSVNSSDFGELLTPRNGREE